MNYLKLTSVGIALLLTGSLQVAGQDRRQPVTPAVTAPANGNGSQRPATPAPSKGPRPYKEIITEKASSQKGIFKLHQVEDKYYLEIADSLLGRDLLVVNRISKAAAANGNRQGAGYAGDIIGETVLQFAKGPEDRLFINKMSFRERATDSIGGMFRSLQNSNIQPIVYSFDIKAYSRDSAGSVVDITPLITTDNDLFFFDAMSKRNFGLGAVQPEKSYVVSVKSYPTNLNIKTVKTYVRTPAAGPTAPGGRPGSTNTDPATYELNSSILLLPKNPMRPRLFDERVGYFASGYVDYDANPQGVETIVMARRWRLEPKPEDVEKYKRGELVEPAKPIIYYIDPTTPKKWIPFLIQGVNDWQVAFEKAGFKNAVMGKIAPTPAEDSTWSLEDARYSAIVYKPSDISNASGPHVADPRTGEIMESHINWYHNVMKLLRDWYMVQAAPSDPRARKMEFDDALMGELIRFVSSHEVGHTLGLRHNFGSSSIVPVEKLRDKNWVEANGHTPSIMDYARFNYVAQPEDGIGDKGIFPRIGDYDKWAIEWGYRWFPDSKSTETDKELLHKMTVEKLKNPRNWFGDGESNRDDPRSQTEDLGDNAMKASDYGIKNLKRILPNLPEWTKKSGDTYSDYQAMYNTVADQFGRYIGHVVRNVGGIERTPKTTDQPGAIYKFTDKAHQKEAVKWVQENVLKTPTWLIDSKYTSLTNQSPQALIASMHTRVLGPLMGASTASKLLRFEAEKPAEAYTYLELMTDLRKGIFSELATKKPVDVYRRSLQKDFTQRLISIIKPSSEEAGSSIQLGPQQSGGTPAVANSDMVSVAKAQAKLLQAEIKAATPLITDAATKMHLVDLQERLAKALKID